MAVVDTDGLSITEAALHTGLTADTLRYYERIGLIGPVPRDGDGRRRYDRDALHWLETVLVLRDTGMPVREMVRYTRLARQGEATAEERRRIMVEHLDRLRVQEECVAKARRFVQTKIDVDDGAPPPGEPGERARP
ncbi:MerR family transcriptional regulator [Nocardiopsis halophila]|uniref:MerR family transcriptional regulator n=1 Tax=Nocardiopsis halophila TaxID=141692 RepID=UPI00036B7572|nr:MerR family transcriptional regulator [Nocardiopsis halophila]